MFLFDLTMDNVILMVSQPIASNKNCAPSLKTSKETVTLYLIGR